MIGLSGLGLGRVGLGWAKGGRISDGPVGSGGGVVVVSGPHSC